MHDGLLAVAQGDEQLFAKRGGAISLLEYVQLDKA
jgi:hypothetical protein